MRSSRAGAAVLAASVAAWAPALFAQEGLPPIPSIDDQEREGRPKPEPPDDRSGHVYIRATSGLLLPAGFTRRNAAISEVAPFGLAVGGAVGVGISRYAELDVAGSYGLFAAPSQCPSCSSDAVQAGVGFSYHLAQGLAVDPWIRYGMAYRTMGIEYTDQRDTSPEAGRYHGLDFLQLSLGASYFPVSSFGFGPFVAADVGTFVDRPAAVTGGTRAYAFFQIGLRLELDPVRWSSDPTPTPTRTGGFPQGSPPSL